MTVESTTSLVQYATDGTTGPFTIPFYFLANADIGVSITDAQGEVTVLPQSAYALTGAGDTNGGALTLADAIGSGSLLTIERSIEPLQTTEYSDTDQFPAKSHERALDKQMMLIQELLTIASRTIRVSDATGLPVDLPGMDRRLDRLLGFDQLTGTPGVTSFTQSQVANAIAAAYAASALADAVSFVPAGGTPRSVQDKLRESVSIRDFGIVSDGSDETARLSTAIAYAAANKVALHFPDGAGPIGFTNIAVNLAGGHFEWSGSPRLRQLAARNPAANALELGGGLVATVALAATAPAGATTVQLTDASMVQDGDTIRLRTTRLMYGDHRFNRDNAFGQLVKVTKVVGDFVSFEQPLVFNLQVEVVAAGIAQAGSAGTITLAAGEAVTRLLAKNYMLRIVSGTGAGQSAWVHEYDEVSKVVDIGTSYTGDPASPWAIVPDATSGYQIVAECDAQVFRPATLKIAGASIEGYAEAGVSAHGVQIGYCDRPFIGGLTISGFSRKALYTYRNYRPVLSGCHFSGANDVTGSGDGLGYGHASFGDFDIKVIGCSADNCRTGFDAAGGTVYMLRTGNTVTGGGLTMSGALFWPDNASYTNSGLSTHTGCFGVTDVANQVADVYFSKVRGLNQVVLGNVFRGVMHCAVQVSYCNGVNVVGNVYDDGKTNRPSLGINGDDSLPLGSSTLGMRAESFVEIRQGPMVEQSSVSVKGNRVAGVRSSLVLIVDVAVSQKISLSVVHNEVDIISTGDTILSAVKANAGTIGFRDLMLYDNLLRVGGSGLGAVKSDNINLYPILSQISTAAAFTAQLGPTTWLCIVPDDGVAAIDVGVGQTAGVVSLIERNRGVSNYFHGLVEAGNNVAILTIGSSGFALSAGNLTGTTGVDGNLTLSARSDGRWYVENRTGTPGAFLLHVDGRQY